MSKTADMFDELIRHQIADMKKTRNTLNNSMQSLEYDLANPPEPINYERIKARLTEQAQKKE